MTEPVNLFAQQEVNRRRSRWLIFWFVLFFAWLGFGGDWLVRELTADGPPGAYRHEAPWLGLLMTVVAVGLAWHAWRSGPRDVLWSLGARELLGAATDAERQLMNVLDEIAIAAGVPRPRLFVVADPDPNALATGHGPDDACIAVTEGLLRVCSRDELQAVIGHELGHVKNYDVRLMTLLAALVGAIALISDGMYRLIRSGRVLGGAGRGGGGQKKGGNPLVLVALVVWLLSWILAPVVSRALALGVSRRREYLADAMSAQFTRNPMALATALEKIEAAAGPTSSIKHGAAHLCIADPLGRRSNRSEGRLAELFGTHPPMILRVSRLKAMAYQSMKRSGSFVPVA